MASLTERLAAPALTPTEQQATLIADLRRRLLNGERIAEEALAAGDASKFRKAMVKYHLRVIQIGFLQDRPDGAVCPRCRYGDAGWSTKPARRGEVWESCLEHIEDVHTGRAQKLAARDAEGLEDGGSV